MGGTVRVKRHAHHQCVGLPLFQALGNLGKAGIPLGGDRALRLGRAQQPVAHRKPGALQAKVQRHKRLQMRCYNRYSCWRLIHKG